MTTSRQFAAFGLISFILAAGSLSQSPAALIVYEGFEYPTGASVVGQNGGFGWANAWQANSSAAGSIYTNAAGSLAYTDSLGNALVTSSNSGYFAGPLTGSSPAQPNRDLSALRSSGTTWVSFLGVRLGTTTNTLPNNPYPRGANLGFYNGTQRIAVGNATAAQSNSWSILPLGNPALVQQSTNSFSQVAFVVVRIEHLGTTLDPDRLHVFVNPNLSAEPATNNATLTAPATNDYSLGRLLAFAGGYDAANGRPNAEIRLDEIRVGDTYADVAPIVGATPPHIVASNQAAATAVNASVDLALGASDADGHPLTFAIVGNPANGSLGALNSNLVTYTPNADYVGPDSFTFRATDGVVTSAVATVSLSITNFEILFPSGPQITKDGTAIQLENYASVPLSARTTNSYPPPIDFANQLGRVNFLRAEPTNSPLAATRFFVCDNNRWFYILDKTGRVFSVYINFEEVFPKFDNDPGYAGGLVSFQFDPEYASNGKFFTVHTENPGIAGSASPTNGALPGLNTNGYTTTTAINPPAGSVSRQSVLVEWTDTNITNGTFEGTARELLRVGFNSNIHPMGDLLFNPLAHPGDTDYRNLYVANGDGGSGEQTDSRHTIPQRLDALQGKILRITPDLNLRPTDELSANGRYRIPTNGPDPNPFVSVSLPNLKKEIFAYGFRNCHRISWDEISNTILECDIGFHSWEEVNIIHRGANYGYAEREGTEQLFVNSSGKTGSQLIPAVPFPTNDSLTVTGLVSTVTPLYPVAQYSHEDGDAIASGFVYRGSLMPQLYGKYIFGEITTGRILYCDLAEMIAIDDGVRTTVATVHELQVVFNGIPRRLFDVIADEYRNKGGTVTGKKLPGSANATDRSDIDGVPYGKGRADIRLAIDSAGELYVLSKSDGMVRKITAALIPPRIESIGVTNGITTLTWPSISNRAYRVQFKASLSDPGWTDLPGDVVTNGGPASKTDTNSVMTRFYQLILLP